MISKWSSLFLERIDWELIWWRFNRYGSSCSLDEQSDDRLSFPDFLALVHEYWVPYDDEKQQLQDAFDILDPQNKSKLMVDEFVYLLKNCDWADEEIDLLLSQVSCADGYFLHDGNEYSMCWCVVFFSLRFISTRISPRCLFFLFRFTKNSTYANRFGKEKRRKIQNKW